MRRWNLGLALAAGLLAAPTTAAAQAAGQQGGGQDQGAMQQQGEQPLKQAAPSLKPGNPAGPEVVVTSEPGPVLQESLRSQRAGRVSNDASVATEVDQRLAAAKVGDRGVRVSAQGEVVTLHGTVASEEARRQAILIASQTKYVRGVVDQLQVRQPAGPSTGTTPQQAPQNPQQMAPQTPGTSQPTPETMPQAAPPTPEKPQAPEMP